MIHIKETEKLKKIIAGFPISLERTGRVFILGNDSSYDGCDGQNDQQDHCQLYRSKKRPKAFCESLFLFLFQKYVLLSNRHVVLYQNRNIKTRFDKISKSLWCGLFPTGGHKDGIKNYLNEFCGKTDRIQDSSFMKNKMEGKRDRGDN